MLIRIALLAALPFASLTQLRAQEDSIDIAKLNDAVAFLAGIELPHEKESALTKTSSWWYHMWIQWRMLSPKQYKESTFWMYL